MAMRFKSVFALGAVAGAVAFFGCGPQDTPPAVTQTDPPAKPANEVRHPEPLPAVKPDPQPVEPKQDSEKPKQDPAPPDGREKKPENADRIYQLNDLKIIKLKIGDRTYKTWVMDTFSKKQEGMMFLNDADVKDDEAMVFVYSTPQQMNFWMKNTRIPLDIAFLNSKKTILNVATMKPYDENVTPSKGAAQYAVEFKAGICKKFNIKAGMKVEFSEEIKSPEDE